MKEPFLFSFLIVLLALGLNQVSYAVCSNVGTTMDGGNILNCPAPVQADPLNIGSTPPVKTTIMGDEINIPLNGGVSVSGALAIDTDNGPDIVTTSGNIISDVGDALFTGSGVDMIVINGGTITSATGNAIRTESGGDIVVINGGTLTGATNALTTRGGGDMVTINEGTINGPISTGGSDDTVLLRGGTYNNTDINLGRNDDMLTFAGDVALGTVDCSNSGPPSIDTIVFSMDVDIGLVPAITGEINAANPTGDNIVINGITYTWVNCEVLVANLRGVVTTISLAPLSAVNEVFTDHTITATVLRDGVPTEGVEVSFEVIEGPNAGLIGNDITDVNGEVTFAYEGAASLGTDTIVASFDAPGIGIINSNEVEKIWKLTRNVPTLSEWGLIAFAAFAGIAGLWFIRRRKATA